MKRIAIAAGTVALCTGLAACSSSASPASPTASSSPATSAATSAASSAGASATAPAAAGGITIKDFGYTGTLTVKAGATVTVTNTDSVAHTLTDKATKKFDTGNIAANGGTGTFVAPSTPGSYPFGCTYHPEMAGTLVVTS